MHMHNLHLTKIRFNSSWQWVRDERCGIFLENATVIPSRVFAVWFQSRQIYGSFLLAARTCQSQTKCNCCSKIICATIGHCRGLEFYCSTACLLIANL